MQVNAIPRAPAPNLKTKIPMKTPRPTLRSGFTLIELLVVISIIAILAGLAMPVFTSAMKKGRITESVSNCKQIVMALRMYSGANEGNYPSTSAPTAGSSEGTALAAGDFSNKAFENILTYAGNKKVFSNKGSAYCKTPQADTVAADSKVLKQGQNDWLYIVGFSDTTDPRWPLIATATKSASELTYTSNTSAKGGVWGGTDAVIGYCDGSARPIGGKEMDTTSPTGTFVKGPINGANILIGTEEWLGSSPIILAPQ
jgi:prepilin-type N-terminal cleavage/methylation domain-containing protein